MELSWACPPETVEWLFLREFSECLRVNSLQFRGFSSDCSSVISATYSSEEIFSGGFSCGIRGALRSFENLVTESLHYRQEATALWTLHPIRRCNGEKGGWRCKEGARD